MRARAARYIWRMNELLGLPYSPWTEKAKWALEVRGVPHRFRFYQPLIGEPALRAKIGRWRGKVTVPVLTDDAGRVYSDSVDIARFADARGTREGVRLFPADASREIEAWIERSERVLDAGRVLSLHRTLASPEALRELVPRGIRNAIGGLATTVGRVGVKRTLRKYGGDARSLAEHERIAREGLDALRDALARSPSDATPKTILPRFSFADIAATQMLAFVSPPTFGLKLGKASREGFTQPALAADYADLVAWRDAIYEAHRPRT